MSQKKLPERFQVWVDARKKYCLSHMQVQMAREMGLNPTKFGRLDNHKQETWKEPLPKFIETLYLKRFSKARPDDVKSMEQLFLLKQGKKQQKKLTRAEARSKNDGSEVIISAE